MYSSVSFVAVMVSSTLKRASDQPLNERSVSEELKMMILIAMLLVLVVCFLCFFLVSFSLFYVPL